MKTSSAKAKGRRCAAEAREEFLKAAPDIEPGDIHVTSSGACGVDLVFSPLAAKRYPFAVECKNVEKINVWEATAQAEAHAKKDPSKMPLTIIKRNRSPMYAVIRLEDFLKLIT